MKFKRSFYSAVICYENCFFAGHFPVAVVQKGEGKECTLLGLSSVVRYAVHVILCWRSSSQCAHQWDLVH